MASNRLLRIKEFFFLQCYMYDVCVCVCVMKERIYIMHILLVALITKKLLEMS